MTYYLVVDKLPGAPGIYGAFSINELQEKNLITMPAYFNIFNKIFRLGNIYDYVFPVKLVKISDIPKKELLIGEPDEIDIIDENIIIINSNFLNQHYEVYDDVIFDGVFKKKGNLKTLFPPNVKNEIVILTKHTARKIFYGDDNISKGLNIANDDNTILYPLADFVSRKWNTLTANIHNIFSQLGAKKIHIKDVTTQDIDVKAKFKQAGIQIDMSALMERKFEINDTFADSIYNPKSVESKLFLLNDVPNIKEKAKMAILNYRKDSEFEFKEILKVNFNLGIDIVASFNGVIKGGYERELNIFLEF